MKIIYLRSLRLLFFFALAVFPKWVPLFEPNQGGQRHTFYDFPAAGSKHKRNPTRRDLMLRRKVWNEHHRQLPSRIVSYSMVHKKCKYCFVGECHSLLL